MASSIPSANGFVVVTHVYPQQSVQAFTQAQNAVSPSSPPLGKFLKGHPVAVGTVQIMIGVVVFLFGIATGVPAVTISVYSGIMFWGAIRYITAGSLTVQADKNLNPCLTHLYQSVIPPSQHSRASGLKVDRPHPPPVYTQCVP